MRGLLQDIRRLSKALRLDADLCMKEFSMMVGIAEEQKQTNRCSNMEAWQLAVEATKRSRARYTITALGPLLEAYCAWICSTSGVEQNFSVREWLVPKRRNLNEQTELDELQICTADCADEDFLFEEAAGVWVRLYGKPRQTGQNGVPEAPDPEHRN